MVGYDEIGNFNFLAYRPTYFGILHSVSSIGWSVGQRISVYRIASVGLSVNVFRYDALHRSSDCGSANVFGMMHCIFLPSAGQSVNVFQYDALHLSSICVSIGKRILV